MMEGRNIATVSKGQGGMTTSIMTRKDRVITPITVTKGPRNSSFVTSNSLFPESEPRERK